LEDNLLNRELLRDWLEVEGYEVWLAVDLTTSYEAFAKQVPDAVLLDINLGADNGASTSSHGWARNRRCAEIPVIAVTAHSLVTEQDRILRAGCQASSQNQSIFKRFENV
jgi:CheY-like chemotaxis protein